MKKRLSLRYFKELKNHPKLLPILEKISGMNKLNRLLEKLKCRIDVYISLEKFLINLDMKAVYDKTALATIPSHGPLVIVANHPLGIPDGLLIAHLLSKIRKDVKIIANAFYKQPKVFSELFIGVDQCHKGLNRQNIHGLREAKEWLTNGGAILVFPGGNLANWNWKECRLTDPKWDSLVVRLAAHNQATILPIYIDSRNSWYFHLLGIFSVTLQALFHTQQFLAKQHHKIPITIGKPILQGELNKFTSPEQQILYLRQRTYQLGKETKEKLSTDFTISP